MAFLNQFDAVLLDMGDTFMFGLDRFGPEQDFHATYREVGGSTLSAQQVDGAIRAGFERLTREYEDSAKEASFPSSLESLCAASRDLELPEPEWRLLDEVFARHECGVIPESHAAAVKALAGRVRLGLLSNVWAESGIYRRSLRMAGILDLFNSIVFSSDHRMVKPCPKLFELALEALDAPRERVVMVGDNRRRDIAPAKRAGLAAVWISFGSREGEGEGEPDLAVSDLRELAKA